MHEKKSKVPLMHKTTPLLGHSDNDHVIQSSSRFSPFLSNSDRDSKQRRFARYQSRFWFTVALVLAICLFYTTAMDSSFHGDNTMAIVEKEGFRFPFGKEPCVMPENTTEVKKDAQNADTSNIKVVEKVVEKVVVKNTIPKVHFVTFHYPEQNKDWTDWRYNASRAVVGKNDRILKNYGGLTVFTIPEAEETVKSWGVTRYEVLHGVEEKCAGLNESFVRRRERELCPKKMMLLHPKFMGLKHVVLLDSDAQIVSPKYMEKILPYSLFADFAAVPDHGRWDKVHYRDVGTEYNTGAFYMNTKAFDNDKFRYSLLEKCKNRVEQGCISEYVRANSGDNGDLWVQFLPWNMHCRWKYYGKSCLLVHNWNKVAFHGLDWVLNNWEEHVGKL